VVERASAWITVGVVEVQPGDYVMVDATCVAYVSAGHIGKMLEPAERIVARERDGAGADRQHPALW
jgi:regulator of RNase E activity RraA